MEGFSKFRWLVGALVLYLGVFSTGTALAGPNPFRTELQGQTGALRSATPGQKILLNANLSGGGIHALVLTRLVGLGSSEAGESNAKLFQGYLLERSRNGLREKKRAVSAALVGDELQILFNGRRRNRFYFLKQKLNSDSRGLARVERLPAFYRLPCGQSALHQGTSAPAAGTLAAMISPAVYSPAKVLDVSTDADYEWYAEHGSNSNAQIQAILSNVDNIYKNQLGLRINIIKQHVFTSSDQPYTSSSPLDNGLLDEFQAYTIYNVHLGSPDLFHLFTGKSISYGVVGLAFGALSQGSGLIYGVVCRANGDYSYGFTSAFSNSIIQYLITAHEMGHNLSARHPDQVYEEDGLPAPDSSLMDSVASASNTSFSAFSIGEITSYLDDYGSCLSNLNPAVSLSKVNLSSGKNFKASLSTSGFVLAQSCRVQLYGSNNKSKLEGALSKAKLLSTKTVSAKGALKISTTVSAGTGAEVNYYFRAKMTCTDEDQTTTTALSAIKSTKAKGGALLKKLAAGLKS